MKTLNTKTLFIAIAVTVLLCSSSVLACSCIKEKGVSINDQVDAALATSTAVFTGKVIEFEYKKGFRNEFVESSLGLGTSPENETMVVKFEVHRWWRSEMPPTTLLLTDTMRNPEGIESHSSCDYRFKLGESYLVYANGKHDALKTHKCTRTIVLSGADQDLRILGVGSQPVE